MKEISIGVYHFGKLKLEKDNKIKIEVTCKSQNHDGRFNRRTVVADVDSFFETIDFAIQLLKEYEEKSYYFEYRSIRLRHNIVVCFGDRYYKRCIKVSFVDTSHSLQKNRYTFSSLELTEKDVSELKTQVEDFKNQILI